MQPISPSKLIISITNEFPKHTMVFLHIIYE